MLKRIPANANISTGDIYFAMSRAVLTANGVVSFVETGDEYQSLAGKVSDSGDSVLIKPSAVGICSSDIPRCFDSKAYGYPLVIGHELSGRVVTDPAGQFKKGSLVSIFPLIPCFKCHSCQKKEYNKCNDYSYYGSRRDGGLQTFLSVKRWNILQVPEKISPINAALIEPLAVSIHAAASALKFRKVLLYGGGFLSQIIAKILAKQGKHISCFDRNAYKETYFAGGIQFTHSPESLAHSSFDCVIDCCGAPGIFEHMINCVTPGGTILQLANPSINVTLSSKDISNFMRKELTLTGTWNSHYRPDDQSKCEWHQAIHMLETEQINLEDLISHSSELNKAPSLINAIYHRRATPSPSALGDTPYNKAVILVNSKL